MDRKYKLVRITTVPISLEKLLEHQLSFMNQYYNVIAVSSDEENLKRVGSLQNVPVFCVEFTRQITPWKDMKALIKLYRFLKKEKPLIVHTHTPKAGIIGMIAAKLAGVPNRLHTIAGLPLLLETGKKRKLLNVVEKITYACATYIYPNSYGLKEIVIKEGFCKAQKLKVIGNGSSNGISTSYFDPSHFSENEKLNFREQLNFRLEDFVFIFIGRLVTDKGINELVSAFNRLSNEDNKIKLLLVGTKEPDLDPLKPETEVIIKCHPNIRTAGYQIDVRPYLAISNVLAFPSYREGLPNVVMQAGAMELPAIVTNIIGCNEIIEDGKNGLIIPSKNADALYQAMIKISRNNKLLKLLKSNSRPMVTFRYEQKYMWEELLKEYKSLELQNLK